MSSPYSPLPEEANLVLSDVQILLRQMGGDTEADNPLRTAVAMKRLEAIAKRITDQVLEAASAQFKDTKRAEKKLMFAGGLLSVYTPATEYLWPVEVVNMETELKAAKELAKKNGTATVKAAESKRAFKVETPLSGATYDVYRKGAAALDEFLR